MTASDSTRTSATDSPRATGAAPATTFVELQIEGMTCASCANRIERKLNKLDDVTAEVNYATEKARVEIADGIEPQLLLDTVEQAGYLSLIHI